MKVTKLKFKDVRVPQSRVEKVRVKFVIKSYTHTVYFYLTFFIADKFSKKMSLKVQRTFSRIESRGLCVGSAQNEITDFAKKTDNFCRNIDYNFRMLQPQFLKA